MSRPVRTWHFLPTDGRLRYGDRRAPADGEWVRCPDGELVLCEHGMHASRSPLDALRWAPGPIACRVEVRGDVIEDDNKLVGRERRILWRLDATELLRHFARLCALDCIEAWGAPPIVLRWLRTGDPAARSAARSAAESAESAARSAARSAAWSAARSAAWSAESAAAWSAAGSAQARRLARMLSAAHCQEVAGE